MSDYFDNDSSAGIGGFLAARSPALRAAMIVAVPFMVADFFNYYSAGSALILTFPLLFIMYAGCGALAARFAAQDGRSDFFYVGASAGLFLWFVSTLVNTIIALVIGAASLGVTLLAGVPYLCLCAPIQLVGGGLTGAIGGFIYSIFNKGSSTDDSGY